MQLINGIKCQSCH